MNLIELRMYLTSIEESGNKVKRSPAEARALSARKKKADADFIERLKGSIQYGW